jgi:pterin-4a-carbinolamine dehydratase
VTPGWPHTLMLANTIGYVSEAAWHHPDLELGYAQVVVKLQTHRVKGITGNDVELARKIHEIALWKPEPGASLQGFPKNWVR